MQEAAWSSFKPPFAETAARYEKTIKERLAAGEVIRHFNGRFEAARMRKNGDLIVMSGFTGEHRLDFAASDAKRIQAHWKNFCEISDQARKRVRGRGRR